MVVAAVGEGRAEGPPPSSGDPATLEVAPLLRARLDAAGEGREVEALIVLRQRADLSGAALLATKEEKGAFVRDALWSVATGSQRPLLAQLAALGVPHRPFYVVNQIWVRAGRDVLRALAAREDVLRMDGNPELVAALPSPGVDGDRMPLTPVSGIAHTRAPEVWALGITGQGVVVGGQDTGYRWDHPALKARYRGWDGTSVRHDYSWHDAVSTALPGNPCGTSSPVPCDDNAHGTHTMGTAVGDDGLGNQIGMAPGATWIGCRDMDRGAGTPATYTACLEFFLAPWPQGGGPAEGDPSRAPDVTINSWACPPSEGCAPDTLEDALEAQRAAGILTVAAAGNSGPGCGTITDPPGLSGAALSVGALQTGTDSVATFSSRGPVSAGGSGRPKPELMAPGTSIRSSVPSGGYAQNGFSGTSMACPHVTGAAALVLSAQPALRGHPAALQELLVSTAVPIPLDDCASSGVPNNVFGWGRLDVKAAVDAARERPILLGLSPASGAAPGGTEVTLAGANLASTTTVSFGSTAAAVRSAEDGGRRLVVVAPPGAGTVDVTVTNPVDGATWRLARAFRYVSCGSFPLTASSRSPACVGYPIVLYASTIPGAGYSWKGPAGFTSTLQNPVLPSASLENAGLYTVTAAMPGCPPAEAEVEVVVVPVPEESSAVIAGCAAGPEDR